MFGIILLITLCTFVIFLIIVHYRRLKLQKRLKNFGFIPGLPLIGNLFVTLDLNNEEYVKIVLDLSERADKSPFFTWMGTELFVGIDRPEDFQTILNSDKLIKKGFIYKYFEHSKGLFVSSPTIWKIHRRILNSAFGQKMVTNFIPIFNEVSKTMTNRMEQFIGDNINMYNIVFNASADAILKTSFGLNWSVQTEHGSKLRNAIVNWMTYIQQRVMRFWLKSDHIYQQTKRFKLEKSQINIIDQFCKVVYEAKLIDLAEKKANAIDEIEISKEKNELNFIQKCIKSMNENKFTMDDVFDEMATIFIGSTDTTATAIEAVILLLAIYQNYQDRILDELQEIFEYQDQSVTSDDLTKMTYLELVIKEALRLFPVGPFIARENTENFEFHGAVIPKGTIFGLNIFKMQRDPTYWGDNALEFYPERFLPENFSNVHTYAYCPFSGGQRNCIGYRYAMTSLKITLAYILRRYKFVTKLKFEDVRIQANLILKIINKDPVQLERRMWK